MAARVPDLALVAHNLGIAAALLREWQTMRPDPEIRMLADDVTDVLARLNRVAERLGKTP